MALNTRLAGEPQETKDRPTPDPDTAHDVGHDTAPQTMHHIDRRPKPLIGEKDKPPHPSAAAARKKKTARAALESAHAQ